MASPSRYPETYAAWQRDPEAFWGEAAAAIDWATPATRIFAPEEGAYGRWFVGGEVNACHNAVDRHVAAGRGDQAAILYDSPVTGTKRRITYAELLSEVEALAAVLQDLGVGRGDRVVLYMPMG
ncbi:acetyl-coenzyme A synthetase N-terminal domain-containing protein, partial [Methylobacterium aquaticum]